MVDSELYNFVKKYGKRTNTLFGVELEPLIYFSYGFVKIDLPSLLNENNIDEIIKIICDIKDISVKKITDKEKISLTLWLIDELEAIGSLEQNYLSSQPEPELIASGIDELNVFGELNIIDSLAGGDILKWEQVKQLPYHSIFDKLRKDNIERKINKNYNKIISKKK